MSLLTKNVWLVILHASSAQDRAIHNAQAARLNSNYSTIHASQMTVQMDIFSQTEFVLNVIKAVRRVHNLVLMAVPLVLISHFSIKLLTLVARPVLLDSMEMWMYVKLVKSLTAVAVILLWSVSLVLRLTPLILKSVSNPVLLDTLFHKENV